MRSYLVSEGDGYGNYKLNQSKGSCKNVIHFYAVWRQQTS